MLLREWLWFFYFLTSLYVTFFFFFGWVEVVDLVIPIPYAHLVPAGYVLSSSSECTVIIALLLSSIFLCFFHTAQQYNKQIHPNKPVPPQQELNGPK